MSENVPNRGLVSIVLVLFLIVSSCVEFPNTYSKLAPGPWRSELHLSGSDQREVIPIDHKSLDDIRAMKIDQIPAGKLPFIMNVVYVSEDSFVVEINNGDEIIRVHDIAFGRSFQTAKDTLEIHFTEYNTLIKATVEDRVMEGFFIDHSRGNYRIPFVAKQGDNYRFSELKKTPISNLNGKWQVQFEGATGDHYTGELQMKQNGNSLTGTVATETGDYRYLDGTVQGDKMYLSTFDGTHLFQFEAKIYGGDSIVGMFYSGKHYRAFWKAIRGDSQLRDPDQILEVDSTQQWDLKQILKDSFGLSQELNDLSFDRPIVLELMGTWCPNCKDASLFLSQISEKYPNVQIIGLGFERKGLFNPNVHLSKYREVLDLPYPIFLGGEASKDRAAKKLPFVNHIYSFPSLFFFDSKGKIQATYSGFYGPATEQSLAERQRITQIFASLK